METIYWIIIGIILYILYQSSQKKKSTFSSFQDTTKQVAELANNDQLFQYTYGSPGIMTRGVSPGTCACSREQLKTGDCPNACSVNRLREPLRSMNYQSL